MCGDEPLTIGDVEIYWLKGGTFHLDGGAMFGPVPKALWAHRCPVDADNTIRMCNDPLLVKTPHSIVLIDTGLGNKLTAKQNSIFKVSTSWDIPAGLKALGIDRSDVTHVVLTHGDFDHAGGVAMLNDHGRLELTCPNAIHFLQKMEWEDIANPHLRSKSVYLAEDFSLLHSHNLELIDGDSEICPGIQLRYSGGHTRGHQLVDIHSGDVSAIHLGDLYPTHFHTKPLWVMAYDNFPLQVINKKIEYFSQYAGQNCWFTFYHDPSLRACQLDSGGEIKAIWPNGQSASVDQSQVDLGDE